MSSTSSTMRAAGRAGKGTALTHDTANNNEEEKPWADKRHFSIIISFYVVVVALDLDRFLQLFCFVSHLSFHFLLASMVLSEELLHWYLSR